MSQGGRKSASDQTDSLCGCVKTNIWLLFICQPPPYPSQLRHEKQTSALHSTLAAPASNQGPFFPVKVSSPLPHSLSQKGNMSHSMNKWRRLVICCVGMHGDTRVGTPPNRADSSASISGLTPDTAPREPPSACREAFLHTLQSCLWGE